MEVAALVLNAPGHSRLREGISQVVEARETAFDVAAFLANSGLGRRIAQFKPKKLLFSQGDPAVSIFYLQKGRANLTVAAKSGKEATIALISADEFVGEES